MNILFLNLAIDVHSSKVRYRYTHPRHRLPPVGFGYCVSIARAMGHTAFFIDTSVERVTVPRIVGHIKSNAVDAVVIRPAILAYELARTAAEAIKRHADLPVLVMGEVVSASPELFIRSASPIDLAIIGEPDDTFREVVQRWGKKEDVAGVAGLCRFSRGNTVFEKPRELIRDLDALPFPPHDHFLQRKYTFMYPMRIREKIRFASMLTSRGCPNPCAHCSPLARVSWGETYRTRSVENILAEIKYLQSREVNTIYFCDDNFTVDLKRVEAICDALLEQKISIHWAAQSRPENLSIDVMKKMKRAGCDCLNLGIESASTKIQKTLNKRIPLSRIRAVIAAAREAGININADFIAWVPGETRRDFLKTLCLARKLNCELITVLLFMPCPGSGLASRYGNACNPEENSMYAIHSSSSEEGRRAERLRRIFYFRYFFRFRYIARYFAGCFSLRNIGLHASLFLGFIRYLLLKK